MKALPVVETPAVRPFVPQGIRLLFAGDSPKNGEEIVHRGSLAPCGDFGGSPLGPQRRPSTRRGKRVLGLLPHEKYAAKRGPSKRAFCKKSKRTVSPASPAQSLFPSAERSSKRPEIGFVQVRRREGGTWKRAPETFPASELTNREALEERFGGGDYELVARCSRNHRITTRARVTVAGEPKPLGEALPPPAARERAARRASSGSPSRSSRHVHSAHLIELFEQGRLQARVFRMFERGCDVSEIVRATKLPVEEIHRLWSERSKPLEDTLLKATEDIYGATNAAEEQRLARARIELERTRADRVHEREQKKLELVARALEIRERELARAPATAAANDPLETLVASLLEVVQGGSR
jgi:hypothetical protein